MTIRHVFVAGVHKSGTTLLHDLIAQHPAIDCLKSVDLPIHVREGQHLQSSIPPALEFGGPGQFAFDPDAPMDERHPLVSVETRKKMFASWQEHWDLKKAILLEKSPPNIIRTRFLQAVFPSSAFVTILRHPLIVAIVTKSKMNEALHWAVILEHTLSCYERFVEDRSKLKKVITVRYESLIQSPQETVNAVFRFLELQECELKHACNPAIDEGYRLAMKHYLGSRVCIGPEAGQRWEYLEKRLNVFGYSLRDFV